MWEITGLVIIAIILYLLPPESFVARGRWSKTITWVVILAYSAVYLYVVRQNRPGRFEPWDVIWIGLMYAYMIIRPISWPLVKAKDLAEFEIAYRFLYLAMFIYALVIRRIHAGLSLQISGRAWLITLGAVFGFIILGTVIGGGFHQLRGSVKRLKFAELFITGGYMFYFVAIAQEIFFRGIIQNYLGQCFGPVAGLICGTIIFGLAHWNYNGLKFMVWATEAGLIYGSVYLFTGNVLCAVICHTLTNIYWKRILTTNNA